MVLPAACAVYDAELLNDAKGGAGKGGAGKGGAGQLGGSTSLGGSAQGGRGGSEGGATSGGTTGGGAGGSSGSFSGGMGGATTGGAIGDAGAGGEGGASGEAGAGGEGGATSGGTTTSGGAPTTGGVSPKGGAPAMGGTAAGGAPTSGGAPTTGGASPKGGAPSMGGTSGGGGSGGSATGGASTGVLFKEDFQTGNASRWTPNVPADFAVVTDGTLAYREGALVNSLRVSSAGDASWTDQSIQMRVKVLAFPTSTSASYYAAVIGRYVDQDNHYYVALRSDAKVSLRIKLAGSNSSISSAVTPDPPLVVGNWYTVRLDLVGTTITGYINGVSFASVTDTSFAAGKIAVGTVNTTAVFDDIVVTDPTP